MLADVTLTDFKVRVIESNSTTAAKVRVLIESTDKHRAWTTIGVSHDVIEASFNALCDALEYKLNVEYVSAPSSGFILISEELGVSATICRRQIVS